MKQSTINKHIANVNRLTKDSQKLSFDAAATLRISKAGTLTFLGIIERCQYVVFDGIQNLAGKEIFMPIAEFLSVWKRGNINAVDTIYTNTAKLITDGGTFEVDLMPSDDAPAFLGPSLTQRHSYFDSADDLRGYAEFVSDDDLRPAMTGVFIGNKDGDGYVCATNGHYLKYDNVTVLPDAPDIILPANVVRSLPKEWQGRIDVDDDNKLAFLEIDVDGYKTSITFQTIDETFPEFLKVIPLDNDRAVCIDVAAAMKALKIAETVNHLSQFAFLTIGNDLHLQAENADTGKRFLSRSIGQNYNETKEYRQAFNAKLLQTILKNTDHKWIDVFASQPNRGATFVNKTGPYLLMPVMMNLENLQPLSQ